MGPSVTLETAIDLVAWHRAVGLGLVSILSFGVVSFGVGAVIALAIRTALRSLSEGVEQIAQGKLPPEAKGARVNEINELHARFQRMAQTMNALIQETGMGATIAVDMDGRVRMLNSLAQLLLSVEPADVMGKPLREVLNGQAGGANSVFSSQLEASLSKQEPLGETPVDLALKGGRRAHVTARTSFFSSDGEQRMAIVLSDRQLVDTTGMRKQIEQAARFLTLGSFATTLAHEIRNPLGSLAGLAELLAEEDPDPALKKEFIEHIQQGTERLNRLIEGLYDIASLGNSEQTPHAVKDIVLDGVGERRHMAKGRQVELVVNVDEGLPLINGNREWLARAVRNLVDTPSTPRRPAGW